MTTIQCEICLHKLATVETLTLPLAGAMFSPPDTWMPPPFAPELDWEWMRCPMCGKRPFILEGRFLLYDQAGYVDIAGGAYRDPETGMLTGEGPAKGEGGDQTANSAAETAINQSNPGNLEDVTKTWQPKPPTVLEEVYRMADAGMKPGQISAELAKAGVTLHQLAIAAKLRARAK